jgi:hypothetical protein
MVCVFCAISAPPLKAPFVISWRPSFTNNLHGNCCRVLAALLFAIPRTNERRQCSQGTLKLIAGRCSWIILLKTQVQSAMKRNLRSNPRMYTGDKMLSFSFFVSAKQRGIKLSGMQRRKEHPSYKYD